MERRVPRWQVMGFVGAYPKHKIQAREAFPGNRRLGNGDEYAVHVDHFSGPYTFLTSVKLEIPN